MTTTVVIMALVCWVTALSCGVGFCQKAGDTSRSKRQAGAGTSSSQWSPQEVEKLQQHILRETNEKRKKHGLQPFTASPALGSVAATHSRNMCQTRVFKHNSDAYPQGWQTFTKRMKKVNVRDAAENIGYRSLGGSAGKWARKVVDGWMGSPTHKKNILNPSYRFLGVGVDGCSNGLGYATQVFSSEAGSMSGQ
jgi:uncharacterized protein YkwD